jgi:hypothetical protein
MIYQFKATFDSLKGFYRQYDLRGKDTLYDFHEHMVNDLHFAPDQVVWFLVKKANGKTVKKYALFDLGDGSMDEITIEQLNLGNGATLFYVFDVHDNRSLRLTFLGTGEALPRKSYPRTSDEQGDAPLQFVDANSKEMNEDTPAPEIDDSDPQIYTD